MNILLVGAGGREHALASKIVKSEKCDKLFVIPENAGIKSIATTASVDIMDNQAVVSYAKANNIDLAIVSPDDPLANGLVDALQSANIRTFGPNQKAAMLESSKDFSKNFMQKHNIPTASFETFTNSEDAISYINTQSEFPIVVKADGLALGKGVIIANNASEARAAIKSIMEDKAFGKAGNKVVIEQFLDGKECTILAFCDGSSLSLMPSSKDHKRALDNDKGLNTGGMGVISPNPFFTEKIAKKAQEEIFDKTLAGMKEDNIDFRGCLYFGLMIVKDDVYVIEYNARFGDPEAQTILPLLETDIVEIIEAVIDRKLDTLEIEWKNLASACVMLCSGGYPASYAKGKRIKGLTEDGLIEGGGDCMCFHSATTKNENGNFLTNGGRVLAIVATSDTLNAALSKAYLAVSKISFENMHYRKDIGK